MGVGRIGGERTFDRSQHRFVRGLVEDDFAPFHGRGGVLLVGDGTLDERRPRIDVGGESGREVVEDDHLVTTIDERVDEV